MTKKTKKLWETNEVKKKKCPIHGLEILRTKFYNLNGDYHYGEPYCPACMRESDIGQLFKKVTKHGKK